MKQDFNFHAADTFGSHTGILVSAEMWSVFVLFPNDEEQ
jgi:hypothetical protein